MGASNPQPVTYDVLLDDGYFCDLIFTGLPDMPRLGAELFSTGFEMVPGANFYYAAAFKRLGLRAGWPCNFGNDIFSQFVLAAARGEELDDSLFTIHDYPIRNLTVSMSFPHERAFVTFTDKPTPQPCPPLIRRYRPRCLLRAGLQHGPVHLEQVAAAREVGALVFMECQSHQTSLKEPQVVEALQAVDIFAPNAQEALDLTGAATVEAALAQLAELTPLVVVKLGSEGAIACQGTQIVTAPALKVNVFDTTGAGDCFNAGFLYGYLRGYGLEDCLKCGNICGGWSTTAHGANAVPTADQLEAHLADLPGGTGSRAS